MTNGTAWMLAALWMTVCAAAVVVSGAELEEAAIPAVPGVAAALVAPLQPAGWRVVTVLTVPLAAVAGVLVVPWAMAGASLALLAGTARGRAAVPVSRDPQQHIMWCRRREERAEVMLVELPTADRSRLAALLEGARATDSLEVNARGRGYELVGVMDGEDLDRAAVERRFARALGDVEPAFGWATFPEDGFTLDVLLEQARGALTGAPTRRNSILHRTADRRPLKAAFGPAYQANRDG